MHPDHRYIEAFRRNDERSIRELYRQHSAQTIRWVGSHGGSTEDAKDVFQEALVAIFEKAQNLDFVLTCPIGALLHVIVSRKWVDRIRQKNRDMRVSKSEEQRYASETEGDVLEAAEEILAENARQARIRLAFQQISEICQQLLNLLAKGTKPQEAATILQMNSVDTLYRRKNACTERWRAVYKSSE